MIASRRGFSPYAVGLVTLTFILGLYLLQPERVQAESSGLSIGSPLRSYVPPSAETPFANPPHPTVEIPLNADAPPSADASSNTDSLPSAGADSSPPSPPSADFSSSAHSPSAKASSNPHAAPSAPASSNPHPPPSTGPRWLLAIFTAPTSSSRRSILRSTWLGRYPNSAYEYRFIVGNYSSRSESEVAAINAENATYGDMWAIEDYTNENAETANDIKNLEFFKYLAKYQGERVRQYDFVSKVDDDNWINLPQYHETFMAPRLPGGNKHSNNETVMTIIGRPMRWGSPFSYASGRMYTLSWGIVEYLAKKYTEKPDIEQHEDVAVEWYLWEDNVQHEFVPVEIEQAWDVGIEYIVDNKTMQIHCIKHDDTILEIGQLFDEQGKWNGKLMPGITSFDRTYKEVITRIGEPDESEKELLESTTAAVAHSSDPWESMDWKLIRRKINFEDRELLGSLYPMNLPGNNVSTDVVPRQLGHCVSNDAWCAHKPGAMQAADLEI